MTTRTGLDAQLGVAEEVTVGTYVAPTRYVDFLSESLSLDVDRIESEGIRAGRRVLDAADWAPGAKTVSGDVSFNARTRDLGLWLKHAFGGVSTSGAGPYTHTFTPGDLFGKGLTVQVGRPDASGTVQPFSYLGCKVSSLTLSTSVGELVEVSASLIGRDESTAQALGTAAYTASSTLWTFVHGALTIGGTATPVESLELSIENGLQDSRHRLGSDVSTEQREEAKRNITLSAEVDFTNLTHYNRLASGATAAVVLAFTSGSDTLTFTMNCRTDGNTPNVDSTEEIPLSLDLKAVGTTDAAAITAVLVNGQSTP